MKPQQGDVLLFQQPDGGNIEIVDGVATMTGGIEVAAYLSLFGGNEEDDGRQENPLTWWGNSLETGDARKYVSKTQNILESLPLTTGNLRRVEEAANADLQWFITNNVASDVTVEASIPALNKIQLDIEIAAFGERSSFTFVENWESYR